MAKTVFITGSSTGIGKATAKHFAAQGWNVVATMRTPDKEKELRDGERMLVTALDVTDAVSIQAGVTAALDRFGSIDVVVNNAGYGLVGTFESMPRERIERQFATNVFGLMDLTREALPHLRDSQGVLVNVASMGGRLAFPFYSVYHATKWAVDGFTESLQFELAAYGVRPKIIEPGAIKTDFYDRSADFIHNRELSGYNELVDRGTRNMNAAGAKGAPPEAVAQVIYRAATDGSTKLRYPVGTDAKALLFLRRLIPDSWYRALVRMAVLR